MKKKRKLNDKVSKDTFIGEIQAELSHKESEEREKLVEIVNLYFEAIDSDSEIAENTDRDLTDIFDDSLSDYLENYSYADNFDPNEPFLYKKDGWWNTAEYLSDILDEKELCEYIYEHQGDFEDYFDFDSIYDYYGDEEEDDEEEEE